jgi:hypothetical protein
MELNQGAPGQETATPAAQQRAESPRVAPVPVQTPRVQAPAESLVLPESRAESQAGSPSQVRLRIDELRLHGFAPSDRYSIADAVERELGRLLETEGLPPGFAGGIALDRIDAGSIQLAGASKPAEIGARIARAIYGGLRR